MFHLANPGKFQKITESLYPFINILAFTIFLIGMYFSFFASPPDYLQGQTVRIMYIHVPSAWLSLSIYSVMAICSCISIVWKHTLSDIVARSAAPIGATFTLVTPSTLFSSATILRVHIIDSDRGVPPSPYS